MKKAYSNALQVTFDAATRQLRRLADPLYFGGMPLPAGHLMKRSTNWFVVGGGGGDPSAWQRRRRETQFGEKWIKRQKDKLVYLDYSPDYCKVDKRIGKKVCLKMGRETEGLSDTIFCKLFAKFHSCLLKIFDMSKTNLQTVPRDARRQL